jgi:hypothetical protein
MLTSGVVTETVAGIADNFAYGDAFGLLGFGMVAATIATFFLRKQPAAAGAPGAH